MIKNYILKNLILFSVIFVSPIYAQTQEVSIEYLDEDRQEDVWTVSVNLHENVPQSVIASVNGKITHGDRFRIRIPIEKAEHCDYGNSFTTFYTTVGNDNLTKLENKIIPAVFKKENINVEILYSFKFLSGHMVFINMGWNDLDSIKNIFQNENKVSLELTDNQDLKTVDYFDVTKNSFSLSGLNEALDRARIECLKIVQNNSMLDTGIIETSN